MRLLGALQEEVGARESIQDMSQGPTRDLSKLGLILAAAEKQFALRGFAGATMRGIAQEAGVGVSLVVYHFETKERLYESVFLARRHVIDERSSRLALALQTPGPDLVGDIVTAMVAPVLRLLDQPEYTWYVRLIFRYLGEHDPERRESIEALFNPLAEQYIAALRTVLPDKPTGFHRWAYLFTLGALTQITQAERAEHLRSPDEGDADPTDLLVRYVTAALTHG